MGILTASQEIEFDARLKENRNHVIIACTIPLSYAAEAELWCHWCIEFGGQGVGETDGGLLVGVRVRVVFFCYR